MSLLLAARLVTLVPSKIADLQENDTVAHILDISSIVPRETKAVMILAKRIGGTGNWLAYPVSHATEKYRLDNLISRAGLLPIKNAEIKWENSVANDDWDLWLYAYFVQKRTR